MIRVLVNGAKGKMGREVVTAVLAQPDMELAGETDLGDDLAGILATQKPDVVVDFTHPSVAYSNAKTIIESGAAGVIGTTGFKNDEMQDLHELALKRGLGLLIAPNFCIGAVLMMRFAEEAARFMPQAEVIELHHPAKADAPSGTAKLTALKIAQARNLDDQQVEESCAFRGGSVSGVHVHSVRLPGLVAHQEVIFGGAGQTLTIRHDSLNRVSFMPGVIDAVRKVKTWKGLVYGLDRILFPATDGIQTGL